MKDNRNPAGDKWQPGQSLENLQSYRDLDIESPVQIQPGDVLELPAPQALTTVGRPTSELPPRVPGTSLPGQYPFSVLVFDTEIHLLPWP